MNDTILFSIKEETVSFESDKDDHLEVLNNWFSSFRSAGVADNE